MTPMASTRVLKLPLSDHESASVLVHASPAGPRPLDLRLVATDGKAPYVCDLRHDRVASLRTKNCPLSEQEWERILGALLQQETVDDIQAVASVREEASMSLTVRKQVKGITQRFGAITLNRDQCVRIELFPWCQTALDALAEEKKAAASLATKARDLDAEAAGLRAQLEELIQAKKEDEAALLLKFRDLLNEKKVKIREQQKIIAASSPPAHRPAESGAKKRKAGSVKLEEDSQDDGDQEMHDATGNGETEGSDAGETSDGTASASGESDDEEPTGSRTVTGDDRPVGSPRDSGSQPRQATTSGKAAQEPPARRNLPFAESKKAAPSAADEETESDDEL